MTRFFYPEIAAARLAGPFSSLILMLLTGGGDSALHSITLRIAFPVLHDNGICGRALGYLNIKNYLWPKS